MIFSTGLGGELHIYSTLSLEYHIMRIAEQLTQTEVAILSLVNERETHGYELNETIEYRGMRDWTDVAFSSIYAVLNRMEKSKLISSRLDPSGKGPARKLYRVTKKGRGELLRAVKLYISEPEPPKSRLSLGAAYIELLHAKEAIECLETYSSQLQERLSRMKDVREKQHPLPFGAEIIFDLGVVKANAELEWVVSVTKQLRTRQKVKKNE